MKTFIDEGEDFQWSHASNILTSANKFKMDVAVHFVKIIQKCRSDCQDELTALFKRINPDCNYKESLAAKPSTKHLDAVLFGEQDTFGNLILGPRAHE